MEWRLFLRLKIKYFTKKQALPLGEKKIKFQNTEKKIFPVLRENGTTYLL